MSMPLSMSMFLHLDLIFFSERKDLNNSTFDYRKDPISNFFNMMFPRLDDFPFILLVFIVNMAMIMMVDCRVCVVLTVTISEKSMRSNETKSCEEIR